MGLIRAHRSHSIRVGQTVVLMAWPGPLVNWISPQSVPEQLPPYSAGAARSGLIDLLQKGHEEVSLTNDEIRTLALWIDLGVPYCGDYAEANAWSPAERQWYDYNQQKRALAETSGSVSRQDSKHLGPADLAGFRPCAEHQVREAKYQALREREASRRQALAEGRKAYDDGMQPPK